jgi:malic enzyme
LLEEVSCAVAKAAMESGVARVQITDWDAYKAGLRKRMAMAKNGNNYPYFIGNYDI